VIPWRVTEAPGARANSRIAAIMYSAGGQAIHAHKPASPGAAMSSPAAMPDVTPTSRNAGTTNRFATGAASEIRPKFTAVIGSVKAIAASVTDIISIAGRVSGNAPIACPHPLILRLAKDIRSPSGPVSVVIPNVAAKLSWNETSFTTRGSTAVIAAAASSSANDAVCCRPVITERT
jgi:hypothetical protein